MRNVLTRVSRGTPAKISTRHRTYRIPSLFLLRQPRRASGLKGTDLCVRTTSWTIGRYETWRVGPGLYWQEWQSSRSQA